MSHISTYQHCVTKTNLFCELAKGKGYKVIEKNIDVSMFGSNQVKDAKASIHITGWKYPMAINQKGEILYDHWESEAGSMERLHSIMQDYNEEAILQDIPMDIVNSYHTEQLKNGDKKLILQYGT